MSRFFKKTDKLQIKSKPRIESINPNVTDMINRLTQSKKPPVVPAFGSTASSSTPPNYIEGPNEQMQNNSTPQPRTENDAGRAPPRRQRRNNWMSSTVSIGQDEAYNKVCNFLKDDEVGMVGIYGMGGVGKTTLMKKIDKEFLKPSYFKVIWVVVSKTVDMNRIQEVIMGKMDLPFDKDDDPYSRADEISDALQGKKVAILFDDIWECLDLEKLGILAQENLDTGLFKLIFTTRSEAVCEQMQSDELIKVEPLGWDDSWALFKRSVGGKNDIESCDSNIVELANEVAKECKGLPLALKVIGGAMVCRRLLEEWRHALATLQRYPTDIPHAEERLFTRLKFSYDSLSNRREKGCFLYTCFYPEDTVLQASLLIECWIGEGILTLNGSYQEVFDEGMNIFRTLQAACLFETLHSVGNALSMRIHDVIRDMGIWIAKSHEIINLQTYLDNEISRTKNTEPRRFSLWYEDSKWPEEAICSNLTIRKVCMISCNFGCFASMSQLRVIILKEVDIDGSPTSIGELTELRHLELIQTNLQRLPDEIRNLRKLRVMRYYNWYYEMNSDLPGAIGELIELRILVCRNKTLPREIGNLHKLEELVIYDSEIEELPKTIGQLTELRKLDVCGKTVRLRALPAEVGNLKKLEVLCIDSHLVEFPLAIGQLVSLKKLVLQIEGRMELPIGLGNLNKLEIFELRSHLDRDCVELIPGDTFRNMHKLRELQIPIRNFKILPPSFFQGLTSLKSLLVTYKGTVGDEEEYIYDEVASFLTQLSPLPLSILRIKSCTIKEFQVPPKGNKLCFPLLETIKFYLFLWLEKMQVMSRMALPSIRVFDISYCRSLKHISGLEHLQNLVVLEIDDCGKLEEVIRVAGDQSPGICFPRLEKLWLTSLPQLKSICSDTISFPSLKDFHLDGCPGLRVLPRGLVKENKAPERCFIQGGHEWYDKLRWQDKDFKAALDPRFRPS